MTEIDELMKKKITPDKNELLRITIYRSDKGGISSSTLGYLKGNKDLISVQMILSEIMTEGLKMLGKSNGINCVARVSASGIKDKNEFDTI